MASLVEPAFAELFMAGLPKAFGAGEVASGARLIGLFASCFRSAARLPRRHALSRVLILFSLQRFARQPLPCTETFGAVEVASARLIGVFVSRFRSAARLRRHAQTRVHDMESNHI